MARAIRISQLPENAGLPGAILAPSYRLLARIHAPLLDGIFRSILESTGVNLVKKHYLGDLRYELTNGSTIYLASFDRISSLRGYTLAWAAIDEATVADEPALMSVLLPCIRGAGSQHVWFTCTPTGLRPGGVIKQFVDRVRAGDPDYQITHMPRDMAPHIPPEETALMRAGMGKAEARQELDAVLLRPSDLVYNEFTKAKHLVDFRYKGEPYSIGCDWGMSHPAFVWVAHTPKGDVVFDEFFEDDVPQDRSKEVLVTKCKALGRDPVEIGSDRAIPQMIFFCSNAFPSAKNRKLSKTDEQDIWSGVTIVKRQLDPAEGPPKLFVARHLDTGHPRGIVESLGQYRRIKKEGSPIDYPYKDNIHDHVMDALRYNIATRYGEKGLGFHVHDPGKPSDAFSRFR
jgi:hypothetical protein